MGKMSNQTRTMLFLGLFKVIVIICLCVNDGDSGITKPTDYLLIPNYANINSPYDIQTPMTLDQKCKEGKLFKIGYQNYTPYVDSHWNIQANAENISGIFPHVLIMMMASCCPDSRVGSARRMSSAYEISKHFDNNDSDSSVDILFPVYGQEGKATRRFKAFPFIPILTAPKIVLLVPDSIVQDIGIRVDYLWQTIGNAWPMWVFIMVSTCLAGLCMWILDQRRNPNDFPPTFFAGSWDGIWWAFITMTTVGYGDLSPKSVFGRIFSMLWISLGVVMISLFTGLVSAALNQSSTTEFTLAGSEVGAVRGSIEYQIGVEHNAEMKYYESHLQMLDELKNTSATLNAALIDNFALTAMSKELNKLGIQTKKELDNPVTYGIVLSQGSNQTATCFREYINNHPQEVFESIADKLSPVKNLSAVNVEVSAVGKAFYEQEVFKSIVYIECGLLIVALVIGLTYEIIHRQKRLGNETFWCRYRGKKSEMEECHELTEKTIIETKIDKDIPEEIQKLLEEYEEYHNKWIDRVRSFYKSPDEEKVEPAHTSPC